MIIKNIDINEWRNYIINCPSATFFHTPDWYLVWEKYTGYKFSCLRFDFSSGNSAIFPFYLEQQFKGMIKKVISSPAGTYGGVLTDSELTINENSMIVNHLYSYKNIQIRLNPISPHNWVFPHTKSDFTQLIEFNKVNEDVLESFSKNHLRSILKARKYGVKVMEATEEEWIEYYSIYIETTKRWKRKVKHPYKEELFKQLSFLDNKQCKLWVAKVDGKITAGAICFYFNQHSVYWHGAARQRFFKYRPVHLLMKYIIEHACKNEIKWFDFNPSSDLKGVIRFKQGFGTKKVSCNIVNKESLLYRTLSRIIK